MADLMADLVAYIAICVVAGIGTHKRSGAIVGLCIVGAFYWGRSHG